MHHTNNRDSTATLALSSLSFSLTSPSSPIHHLRRRNAHRHPHHTSRLRSRFPLRRSCLAPVPPISRSESTREQQHPQLLAPASHYRARCCSSLHREDGNPTTCSSCCSCDIPSISWPRPIPTSLSFPWRISMALNTSSKRTKSNEKEVQKTGRLLVRNNRDNGSPSYCTDSSVLPCFSAEFLLVNEPVHSFLLCDRDPICNVPMPVKYAKEPEQGESLGTRDPVQWVDSIDKSQVRGVAPSCYA